MVDKDYNYFIDAHNHYNETNINKIENSFKNNKLIAITCSVDFKSYEELLKIQSKNINNLFFAYGFYPEEVIKKSLNDCYKDLEKMDFTKASAIGEIGLDYKITKDKIKRNEQIKLFEKQLEIAKDYNLPVEVHSRYATKPVLEILKSWTDLKIILHWFTGNENEIEQAFDLGFNITQRYGFPLIKNIKEHINQILIETDYPVPYNNTQKIEGIIESYNQFSKQYNITLDETQKLIYNNFKKTFPKIKIR